MISAACCRRREGEDFLAVKQLQREILRGFRAAAQILV
jgi:hypothetical protein